MCVHVVAQDLCALFWGAEPHKGPRILVQETSQKVHW